jgi:hypothetical protein
MTVLSALYPTLTDITRQLGPNGQVVTDIVDILTPQNECLDDFVWLPTNNKMSHRTTTLSGYSAPTWRKLYGFTSPTKATFENITDTCGMLEDYSHVDKDAADMSGNPRAIRKNQDMIKVKSFNKTVVEATFYSNDALDTPEQILGLSPRFADDDSTSENFQNIIKDTNGTPDTSLWLCVWGPESGFHLYPEGTTAGLSMTDDGVYQDTNGSGGYRKMYQTHFKWHLGLCIRDWRYFVRIQFDKDQLLKSSATQVDLIDLMTQALELPPSLTAGRTAFYANRHTKSFLRRQIANKVAASTLTMETVMGRHVMTFDGIPVRRCDALLGNENTSAPIA